MSVKAHVKAAFENTTGIARSYGPQEAYQFAERMANSTLSVIDSELEKIIEGLRYTGDIQSAIEKLENFTK